MSDKELNSNAGITCNNTRDEATAPPQRGLFSGGNTETAKFTAYVNAYMVVSKGGNYTKHIYIGNQRIVSKLGDLDSYGADPRRIEYAGANVDGANVQYANKYSALQQTIKDRYAAFEVEYYGKDNDDYVNGQGFCCTDAPAGAPMRAPQANDNPELFQYYYHSDHLGSTSLITDLDGNVVQHVEYIPFGEVFIEERNNKWNTPYLFNAKELDEETGLYYYGARYYDPRVSLWLSADPLQEDYPNISTYAYAFQNPIKFIDPTGKSGELTIDEENCTITITSNIIFYGDDGNTELSTQSAQKIQDQWNAVGGTVSINGTDYSVNFVVTGSYDNSITSTDISSNTDIKNNYIKLVSSGIDVSYMDAAGSNTGVFLISNIQDAKSTTEAHEFGHGFGLEHPTNVDFRGQGQPSIMYPRGTAVDAPYTYNPSQGATVGTPGINATNTMNPTTRIVTQSDINNLGVTTNTTQIGKLTNRSH
ncbi:hypothetical protein FACS189429_1700 [Bacteroidia bacterium]|nr:hypothetical protein FACS189429_1700 [Bacteroidia bacterium]GHV45732.1 hypothetical protein FACS1894180_8480 [Bacteroidia bacterium]